MEVEREFSIESEEDVIGEMLQAKAGPRKRVRYVIMLSRYDLWA